MKIIRDTYGYIELDDLKFLKSLNYELPKEYSDIINICSKNKIEFDGFFKVTDIKFLNDISLMDFIIDYDYLRLLSIEDLIILYDISFNDYNYHKNILKKYKNTNDKYGLILTNYAKGHYKACSLQKYIDFYTGKINYTFPKDIVCESDNNNTHKSYLILS